MSLIEHVCMAMLFAAPAGGPRTKAELYGDPALVPTRAGERAREEVALAGAVAAGLRAIGVEARHVEVRLPRTDDPGAVVVIAGAPPPGRGAAEIERLIADLCGPWSRAVIRVEVAAEPLVRPREGPALPLYAALVGLGASLGVALERARRRRR